MTEAILKTAQLSLTFLILLGIGLYILDRTHWWQATYRWIHDFFHSAKSAMPRSEVRGVFYNQRSATKWVRISLCTTLVAVASIWHKGLDFNLAAELIVWLLGIPAMLLGMVIGYLVHRFLIPNQERIFDWTDKAAERLEHASLAGAGQAVRSAGDYVAGGIAERLRGMAPGKAAPTQAAAAPPPPPQPEPPAESVDDVLRRIRERG